MKRLHQFQADGGMQFATAAECKRYEEIGSLSDIGSRNTQHETRQSGSTKGLQRNPMTHDKIDVIFKGHHSRASLHEAYSVILGEVDELWDSRG